MADQSSFTKILYFESTNESLVDRILTNTEMLTFLRNDVVEGTFNNVLFLDKSGLVRTKAQLYEDQQVRKFFLGRFYILKKTKHITRVDIDNFLHDVKLSIDKLFDITPEIKQQIKLHLKEELQRCGEKIREMMPPREAPILLPCN